MENKSASGQIQNGYFVAALASCKTILQSAVKISCLLPLLTLSLAACNNKTENHTHNPPPDYTGAGMNTAGGGNGGGSVTGTGDGGGGQGVYCSEKVKDPRFKDKVVLRDIYEAIKNHSRILKVISHDVSGTDTVSSEAIHVLVDSLKHFYGPASMNLEFVNEKFWIEFSKRIHFLDEGYSLHPSQDANSAIALPNECKIVQVAFWDESAGVNDDDTLYIKKSLWVRLDQTSKIGLLAHEFFFKQARKAGYNNSDFVRYKIGELFSVNGLEPIFSDWSSAKDSLVTGYLPANKEKFKYCKGVSESDPTAKGDFYHYIDSNGLEHIVVMNVESKLLSSSILSYSHTKFKSSDFPILSDGLSIYSLSSDLAGFSLSQSKDFQELIKFKYIDSGYFRKEKLPSELEFIDYLRSLMEKLASGNKIEIWSNYISSKNDLRISLVNPGLGFDRASSALLGQDILKRELISLARQEMSSCDWMGQQTTFQDAKRNSMDRDAAINILLTEIDRGLKSGVYPEKFKRWNAALVELDKKYPSIKVGDEDSYCQSASSELLTDVIPEFLFKVQMGSYVEDDFRDLQYKLGSKRFEKNKFKFNVFSYQGDEAKFKKPVLKIGFGGQEVDLQMKCETFIDVYSRVASQRIEKSLKSVNMNDLKIIFNKSLDERISYKNVNEANSQQRDSTLKIFLANKFYKQVYNILSARFKRGSVFQLKPVNVYTDFPEVDRSDDGAPGGLFMMQSSLKVTLQMFKEMNSSESAEFKPCEGENYGEIEDQINNRGNESLYVEDGCVFVKPSVSLSWYKVHFSSMDTSLEVLQKREMVQLSKKQNDEFWDTSLKIKYVQRVPND